MFICVDIHTDQKYMIRTVDMIQQPLSRGSHMCYIVPYITQLRSGLKITWPSDRVTILCAALSIYCHKINVKTIQGSICSFLEDARPAHPGIWLCDTFHASFREKQTGSIYCMVTILSQSVRLFISISNTYNPKCNPTMTKQMTRKRTLGADKNEQLSLCHLWTMVPSAPSSSFLCLESMTLLTTAVASLRNQHDHISLHTVSY